MFQRRAAEEEPATESCNERSRGGEVTRPDATARGERAMNSAPMTVEREHQAAPWRVRSCEAASGSRAAPRRRSSLAKAFLRARLLACFRSLRQGDDETEGRKHTRRLTRAIHGGMEVEKVYTRIDASQSFSRGYAGSPRSREVKRGGPTKGRKGAVRW